MLGLILLAMFVIATGKLKCGGKGRKRRSTAGAAQRGIVRSKWSR